MPEPAPFEQTWRLASGIDGWLTEEQARVLHAEARRVAPDRVVEIGSHLGRSTVVLAAAGAAVTAVDPFPDDWRYGRTDTEARLRQHLAAAGVADRVDVRATTSRQALASWGRPVRLVYVDGKHDVVSCLADLRWTHLLAPGDRFLVHDAFGSVGVTLALLWWLVRDRRSRFISRTGSLALYEVGTPTPADRVRVLAQLPWFARNVVVKLVLRLRLHRGARALGHEGEADPF